MNIRRVITCGDKHLSQIQLHKRSKESEETKKGKKLKFQY